MSDDNTVRILSLDGGGIRGLFSTRFLERFCNDAEIQPNKLFDHFDLITGTSIGAVCAIAYCYGLTPAELQGFFRTKGPLIFKDRSILPGYKERVMMGLSTDKTFYPQEPLHNALSEILGDQPLNDLNGRLIVTSWNMSENIPVLFSNVGGYEPYLTGSDVKAVDAALASAAAPLYFPQANIAGKEYIDGGVIQNNPSLIGLIAARRMFPQKTRVCLLSVGTGLSFPSKGSVLDANFESESGNNSNLPDNVQYLFYLLDDIFISGVQKFTDTMLGFYASSFYEQINYYRFQYQYPKGKDAPMDNVTTEYMDELVSKADSKYEQERLAITNFVDKLRV